MKGFFGMFPRSSSSVSFRTEPNKKDFSIYYNYKSLLLLDSHHATCLIVVDFTTYPIELLLCLTKYDIKFKIIKF